MSTFGMYNEFVEFVVPALDLPGSVVRPELQKYGQVIPLIVKADINWGPDGGMLFSVYARKGVRGVGDPLLTRPLSREYMRYAKGRYINYLCTEAVHTFL